MLDQRLAAEREQLFRHPRAHPLSHAAAEHHRDHPHEPDSTPRPGASSWAAAAQKSRFSHGHEIVRVPGSCGEGLAWRGRFAGGVVGIALDRWWVLRRTSLPGWLRLLSGVFLPAAGVTAGYIL